jgi:hypothetical protein
MVERPLCRGRKKTAGPLILLPLVWRHFASRFEAS